MSLPEVVKNGNGYLTFFRDDSGMISEIYTCDAAGKVTDGPFERHYWAGAGKDEHMVHEQGVVSGTKKFFVQYDITQDGGCFRCDGEQENGKPVQLSPKYRVVGFNAGKASVLQFALNDRYRSGVTRG